MRALAFKYIAYRRRTVPVTQRPRSSKAQSSPTAGGMPAWAMRLAEQHRVQFSEAHAEGEDEARAVQSEE